ncbi:hypothetical protein MCM1_0321 [Methanosarcina barkeri CM1]|uniref:Uncharacterized protein n=1 Tax=Methanosarcina barkeri CM1 TaxID=796385 RepID=A0A0G3C620_METBA|nr:hypothetical protein MCM1_0321 [Methanosarcina barkeri CM1]
MFNTPWHVQVVATKKSLSSRFSNLFSLLFIFHTFHKAPTREVKTAVSCEFFLFSCVKINLGYRYTSKIPVQLQYNWYNYSFNLGYRYTSKVTVQLQYNWYNYSFNLGYRYTSKVTVQLQYNWYNYSFNLGYRYTSKVTVQLQYNWYNYRYYKYYRYHRSNCSRYPVGSIRFSGISSANQLPPR